MSPGAYAAGNGEAFAGSELAGMLVDDIGRAYSAARELDVPAALRVEIDDVYKAARGKALALVDVLGHAQVPARALAHQANPVRRTKVRELASALADARQQARALSRAIDRDRICFETGQALVFARAGNARGLPLARVLSFDPTVGPSSRTVAANLGTNLADAFALAQLIATPDASLQQQWTRDVALPAVQLLAAAARLLPAIDRDRLAEEYSYELGEIARAGARRMQQIGYAARQLIRIRQLRCALKQASKGGAPS